MALNKTEIGKAGERTAAEYLRGIGFSILEKNYRFGHKEIDLVCLDGDYIVFVEVKARSGLEHGLPAEYVNARKQSFLRMAASMYLKQKGTPDAFCRFDIVEVYLKDGTVHHIPNAF